MTVLVNASTLIKGGAIQVSVWFISCCIEKKHDCFYVVSKEVFLELESLYSQLPLERFVVFDESPSKSESHRKKLLLIEQQVKPKLVFTIFGPSYVNFQSYHVMGFADGWVTHSSIKSFYKTFKYDFFQLFKALITCFYKGYFVKKADEWIVETQVAARGLSSRLFIKKNKINIIPNNCNSIYYNLPIDKKFDKKFDKKEFKILYYTADYPHKCINKILDYVILLNQKYDRDDFKFYITIDPYSQTALKIYEKAKLYNVHSFFKFLGYVPISKGPELYDSCDLVIQISNLETFSANYPEAMARNKPLLVSDYPFSRDACGEAAIYINTENKLEVVRTINLLMNDEELIKSLIQKGKEQLKSFPDLNERFSMYEKTLFHRQ